MHRAGVSFCAAVSVMLAASAAGAQERPDTLPMSAPEQDTLSVAARLVMRQPAGTVLRLNAGNVQVTGVLESVAAGTVQLSDPPRALPLSSITDAWLQRRSTARGGRAGAIIGAGTGAAVFGLGTAVLSGVCSDCDWGAGEIAVGTLIGAAAGATSGYIVGALIGASVPRWEPLTETSAPATIVSQNPRRRPGLSAFSVTPAVARAAAGDNDVGAGLGISYLSQLSRHIAVGGEVARYGIATSQYGAPFCTPPSACLAPEEFEQMWSYGALGRFGSGAERTIEPYALVGVGVTNFGAYTLGSYSAGPGIRVRAGRSRFAASGEARWHSNFTNDGEEDQLGFYTFGLAVSLLR
jgi:hypothetical protein